MQFPLVPAAISIAVAAADGVVGSYDVDHNTAAPGEAPGITKGKALWVQGGAIALGVLGEFADWHPDITEPLMFTGAALLAREVAFKVAQSGQPAASRVTAQGLGAPRYNAFVAEPAAQERIAAPVAAAAYRTRQASTIAG